MCSGLSACPWLLINQETVLATWLIISRKPDFLLPGFIGLCEGHPGEGLADEQETLLRDTLSFLSTRLIGDYRGTLA